jgi:signal transduction histidine kinase
MDEQAKLIIRTDLELNKTQEELDKKISGLYTLQKISRAISTTLQEEEIFRRIERSYLLDLGFTKALSFLLDKDDQVSIKLNYGYTKENLENIEDNLKKEILPLIKKDQRLISSVGSQDLKIKELISSTFGVSSFILSPLSTKEGLIGLIFLGNESEDSLLTEGDEELASILASSISQALENARLFEETYRSHQELERKVEERTKELSLALEEIKRVSKRKTDFVSAVSHELRTPLTSIKGYASILLGERLGELPSEVKERLERMNRHCDELTNLVNDLLDLSRIETGRLKFEFTQHRLFEITKDILELLSVQIREKDIKIELNIPKEITVFVDKNQINRVFINLLGNALKFTPEKGKIQIEAKNLNGFIQVDISDTGIGIPEKDIPFIFDEFYRVDNPINQKIKGTGLGLSLVKSIIEAHRGNIWVESKLGEGSKFSFTLPKQDQNLWRINEKAKDTDR